MTPWRYARIRIPELKRSWGLDKLPIRSELGNWTFFYIGVPGEKGSAFRYTNWSTHTIGLDGVE